PHQAALACVDGRLGDEERLDLFAKLKHLRELLLGADVERGAEAARRRILRERLLRRERVGRRALLVARVRRGNELAHERLEKCLVCHLPSLFQNETVRLKKVGHESRAVETKVT